MTEINEIDTENILISSESLLDKTRQFIDIHVSGVIFSAQDDVDCLTLIDELKNCLVVLESMHETYQALLLNNQTHTHGLNTYAQSLSLTSCDPRGDISNVE